MTAANPVSAAKVAHALGHRDRGYYVFPARTASKTPAVKQWEHTATRDPNQIRSWWHHHPTDNIAIACGPSQVHVLDLDTEHHHGPETSHDRDGRHTLTALADRVRQPLPIPTHAVHTPSGGLHLYYRAPTTPPLRNTVARLGRHIDTRGAGGYVIAAGSTLSHGVYRLLDNRTPIDLPAWLIELLNAAPPTTPTRPGTTVTHPDAYIQAALTNQSHRVRNAVTGTRHHTLLRAANSLGRLIAAGLLDHDHAHTALSEAASVHVGIDCFTQDEVGRTITDGLTYATTRTARLGTNLPNR